MKAKNNDNGATSNSSEDGNDDNSSTSSSSSPVVVDEEPPPPVSSDEDEADEAPRNRAPSQLPSLVGTTGGGSGSRFFAPYRTLGLLSNGAGFYVMPHQHSGNAVVVCPTGDRLQMLSCERLQPVLVSQRVSTRNKSNSGTQNIVACVADATLAVSIAVHQAVTPHRHNDDSLWITLLSRTRPLQRLRLTSSSASHGRNASYWQLAQLLHLGRIKVEQRRGEKQGRYENAAVVVAVLRRSAAETMTTADEDGIPFVGNDGDDHDDDEESVNSSEDENEEDNFTDIHNNDPNITGQVVVMIVTRSTLTIQTRIPLHTVYPYTAAHPATYVNKIVIGGIQKTEQEHPGLILLNIRSKQVIHEFKCLSTQRSTEDRVTALTQSPAVDTMAVGTATGAVHLINLRLDKLLFSVHNSKSQVQSISFRTDSSALQYQIAPMAVGTRDGSITVWDLSPPGENDNDYVQDKNAGRTILCEMKHVHLGGIAQLEYLPQEPLLLSTGLVSNAVKMHIFDNPDHTGRILRQRVGHAKGPPKVVSYLHPSTGGLLSNAADGTDAALAGQLVSAGSVDRAVRLFSSARSALDKEFGQGAGLEKRAKQLGLRDKEELLLPVVKDMAFCQARTRDWGDMVTIHQQHSIAYVWSTKRGAQTGPVLRQPEWNVSARKPPPPASTHATSLSLSPCGNFCIVGTVGGKIYKYNVQSGQPRGSYPPSIKEIDSKQRRGMSAAGNISRTIRQLEKDSELSNRKANVSRRELDTVEQGQRDRAYRAKLQKASHTDAVTGLAVDAMNKTVISVGRDAKLILWSFSTHAPHQKCPHVLPAPACKLAYVRDSDMASIALEDYSIFLFDCTALNIVRRLGVKYSMARHTGPITGMEFSPDGRSLYSASLDSTIRMWDVPTSTCVDWMTFASAPTSVTVSPTGEYLATTHANKLGISLWSDRSFYQTIHTDGKHIQRPYTMDEPMPASEAWEASATPPTPTVGTFTARNPPRNDDTTGTPAVAKETGLITLSGLPAAHWKNLFHLELIKERNKPKEPPKKPPSAPFFLQWRGGEAMSSEPSKETGAAGDSSQKEANDEEWASAWTDENEEEKSGEDEIVLMSKRNLEHDAVDVSRRQKRPKVTRYRSKLATSLMNCSHNLTTGYQEVIDYIAGLGPSAIDVELSSLCAGLHDLDEGIPLLCVACDWFLECCQRRDRFEAVNAYLHRFLHLHGPVIAGIKEDTFQLDYGNADATVTESIGQSRKHLLECIVKLQMAQEEGYAHLRNKMQHSLCLLRHLTRMV